MNQDREEHQRLYEDFRLLSDSELLHKREQLSIVPKAEQAVVEAELARRGLLANFAALSAAECIWDFPESEDAQAAGEMLEAEGIDYDLILPDRVPSDMGAPRIAVLPADIDRVRDLLSKPIPEEFRMIVRTRGEFVAPNCPKCTSSDPLLESIEPTNNWRCEVCGKRWSDNPPTV